MHAKNGAGQRLSAIVAKEALRLQKVTESQSLVAPRPEKWCPKEVLGHLVDSGANNHQRFVRAQGQADLVFSGYDQDEWLRVQRYRDVPWSEIVTLWASFNRHLAHLMSVVPETVRLAEHSEHNFDQIAFRVVPPGESTTLQYLMDDYVGHLQHHLAQIA